MQMILMFNYSPKSASYVSASKYHQQHVKMKINQMVS
jgi:hypothetical protein